MAQIAVPVAIIVGLVLALFGLVAMFANLSVALVLAFVFISAAMMLVVLIQRPKGGGLSGAFGGAGGDSGAVFGSKVGDVLTWVTVGFFVAFVGTAMALVYTIRAEVNGAPAPEAVEVVDGAAGEADGTDAGAATDENTETDAEAAAAEGDAAAQTLEAQATEAAEQAATAVEDAAEQAVESAEGIELPAAPAE